MANYSNLKAAIAAAIKQNGNQEITGQVLQDVLTSIVSVIGANYTFAGVATPSTNPGTPDQNLTYLAMEGGTYTNFNGTVLPAGISLLMWNGTWMSETVMYGDGGVFDISVYKSSGGTLAKFADLAAALDGGNNIPTSARKGGMSVKFVQSSDNNYIQARLMANAFTTDITKWQVVDDEPTAGSDNLVRSGGVKKHSTDILQKYEDDLYFSDGTITTNTSPVDINTIVPSPTLKHCIIDCVAGDEFIITGTGGNTPRLWCFIDSSNNVLSVADKNITQTNHFIIAPENATKLILNYNFSNNHSLYKCRTRYSALFLDSDMRMTAEEKINFINNALQPDNKPTRNSVNLVRSGGVFNEIHNRMYYEDKNSYLNIGGYYGIVGSVGDTIIPSVVSQERMMYAAIPCSIGDKFMFTIRGITLTAAIAIIDNNNIIRYIYTDNHEQRNKYVTSPCDGTLYVNTGLLYPHSIIKILETDNFDINKTAYFGEGVIASIETLTNCADCKILVTDKLNLGNATIELHNVELVACGGYLMHGTLTGDYKIISDDYQELLDSTLVLSGHCKNKYLSICLYGAKWNQYDKDSNISSNFNKIDSTVAIQNTINNAKSCGVNSVYVPSSEGAFFVRCQTLAVNQLYQGDSAIFGENAALSIPDNIEIFGKGEDSKLVVVDFLISGEDTAGTYRTQQLMALANYTDEELDIPLIDTSVYQTALQAVNANAEPYLHKKYGRHDITIHHLWLSTRKYANNISSTNEGHAIAINLCSNILAGAEIAEQNGNNIRVYDCIFYDTVQAVHVDNSNYDFTEEGQAVIFGVKVYNNIINKVYNKAIEFSSGSRGNIAEFNTIRNASCALQCIFNTNSCLFNANIIEDCEDGINIAHYDNCKHIITNNIVRRSNYPIKFRADARHWEGEKAIRDITISDNIFIANDGKSPLTFMGHANQYANSTGCLLVKNLLFKNNIFEGQTSWVGCTDTLNKGGYQAWKIIDIVCDGNVWNSNISIINDVTQSGTRPISEVQKIIFKDIIQSGKTLTIQNASAYLLDVLNNGTINSEQGTILVNRVLNP